MYLFHVCFLSFFPSNWFFARLVDFNGDCVSSRVEQYLHWNGARKW